MVDESIAGMVNFFGASNGSLGNKGLEEHSNTDIFILQKTAFFYTYYIAYNM